MQEKDLIKYIKGEVSPDTKKSIIDWIRKDTKNQELFNSLKAKYIASNLEAFDDLDTNSPYQLFYLNKKRKKRRYYSGAVALILLPILIWYGFNFSENTPSINTTDFFDTETKNVATKYGAQETVILPDGSVVVLNSNSSLSYNKNFSDSIRTVVLVGEAFFDIKRDTTKPFIVKTEHIKVKVLGTSFNVKSYPKDENIETTLVTGKVEVLQQKVQQPIILTPSERATFDKKKRDITIDKVDSKKVVAWKQGKLIFDKTPLKQVVLDLKRKYNVEFVIESDSLLNYKYTGEFDNLSLEEVLKLFKLSSSINYKYNNNKVMLNSE